MDASYLEQQSARDLAELGRQPRRAASWALALIATTLAFDHWPTLLLDTAILYLVCSPLIWHARAQHDRAGVALLELFVTPLVLIATAMDIALVAAAVYGLLLARLALHGIEQWQRAFAVLLAGVGCGAGVAQIVRDVFGVTAFDTVTIWHSALVALWINGFGCAVALLSFARGKRNAIARRRAADKTATLGALAQRLGRYLAPQVHANLLAEITRDVDQQMDHLRVRHAAAVDATCARAAPPLGPQRLLPQRLHPQRLQARRRWLTVFFSDIVGFTALTEALEPEEVASLLNAYLDAMTTIALEHGGTIDKFIGDAIMIFFGDPHSRGRAMDALSCVQMALAMQRRIDELAARAVALGVVAPLQVRIGIASGFCTVGDFGAEHRLDYTALGRAVNLASRLETVAAPGTVLLSATTAALIDNVIALRPRGLLCLAGVAQPVEAYVVAPVVSSAAVASPAAAAAIVNTTPIVSSMPAAAITAAAGVPTT